METALGKRGKLIEEGKKIVSLSGSLSQCLTDIRRERDVLAGRLKLAEYIAKTLATRIETMDSILSSLKDSTASDSSGSRPNTPQDENEAQAITQPPNPKFTRPVPPPLVRRHTTMATATTREMAAGGWEERAAAFMMKRRSQQSAREQGELHSPPLSPSQQRFPHQPARYFPQSTEQRPSMHRFPSDREWTEGSGPLSELDRRKQASVRGELISMSFIRYQNAWEKMGQRLSKPRIEPYLTFATVPWPIAQLPNGTTISSYDEITIESVREFILSPFHSTDRGKESRVREAFLRWHPDHSSQWLDLVQPIERTRVLQGIDKVNLCLNHIK
ncbi:hypothetical protein FRC17_003779 [Serendipita sp. 399]|nr:hypothetical protein FRC17_003779 [Serendipita sp. 399]